MQHPRRRGAYAVHSHQVRFGRFQHPGKVAESVDQLMGQLVGIFSRVSEIQHQFQRFVGFQIGKALLFHPVPHPLAMPRMRVLFFGHGRLLSRISAFNSTVFSAKLKSLGRISALTSQKE